MIAKYLRFLLFILLVNSYNCSVDPENAVRYATLLSKSDLVRLRDFYPGTLWCGPGTLAENYEQLGMEMEVDKCCRTLNCCPDYMDPGETGYDLINDGEDRRYSCECYDKLRKCFREVGNPMSDYLGREYFDYSGIQCFRKDYPVLECIKRLRKSLRESNCVEYSYDTNCEKIYQWFVVSPYSDN